MMSFKEFKAAKVAGPPHETISKNSILPSTSLTPSPSSSLLSSTQEELHIKMCKIFTFIDETYRDLRRFNASLKKNLISTQLIQTINKYKNGCNENYPKALESYDMCYKLAQNIVRTIDIFKDLCTCLSDLEEYNYRLCEIMSIFIVCELRLSVDAAQQEQLLIAHRIIYIMRRHLVQEEEHETVFNILRTLVYIPKLFNAREIMCAIFGEFIPIKPVLEVNVLPDKLYMLYIIVFYRWMMMQKDDDDKMLIVNFAESFMKPSVSLCSNNLYGAYLPIYTTHSTATRTILNNLKYYRDIRNASIIDNALKKMGSIVNLCDDEEDDIIVVDTSTATDFAKIFASVHVEPLNGGISNIKLEEKTVVSTVDLTEEEEPANPLATLSERHDKWLNEFQKLAKQYRESQLLIEKQQTNQMNSNGEKEAVICLDSDSEEDENISAVVTKEIPSVTIAMDTGKAKATQQNSEDLFVDNYPLTNTPINCDSDLESLEAADENDVTKISPRFLSGTLRTYQAKKSNLSETEDKNNSDSYEHNKAQDINKAYRRDSIHISSSPPEGPQNEDDDGTDVQDEHDLFDEGDVLPKQIRPMGPYPTYNNMHNDKVVYSQTLPHYPQQQKQYQDKQYYYSDSSEVKNSKKQKKRVQFNISPIEPMESTASQKVPLKPALQRPKYKASDAPNCFLLRGFERFACAPSIAGSASTSASNSTSSSIKQQEHLAAAATLFRNVFDTARQSHSHRGQFSPSSPSTTRKKSRPPKNKKHTIKQRRTTMSAREDLLNDFESTNYNEERYSIIRNRGVLNDGYHTSTAPSVPSFGESSDDYYGIASDSDMITNKRYKKDAKLRKRCAVVITPTKELIQYERKRDEMYNEILQKQRIKLELRALEKQKEKERRRPGRREEKREQSKLNNKGATTAASDKPIMSGRRARNYNEIFMSSESEYETNFEVRTRKHRQQKMFIELEPLKVQTEMTEATTTTLLSQIDAHLDKPESEKSNHNQFEVNEQQQRGNQTNNSDIGQQTCDISRDKGQTKMRELNLLADIAQHLSPYQLDLPENIYTSRTSSPALEPPPSLPASQTFIDKKEMPKEKVTVTEHLIIQSVDNLLGKIKPQLSDNDQQQASTSYAHEAKLNKAAIFKSSHCANLLQYQNQNQQSYTQLEENNDLLSNNATGEEIKSKKQTDETLEQILEKSISVFKSVAKPFNIPNESDTPIRPQTHSDSTIPLLISNVESINYFEQNDTVEKQKSVSEDKEPLLLKDTAKENSVNEEFIEKEINEETKEKNTKLTEVQSGILNANEPVAHMSSAVLNSAESSDMYAADLTTMQNGTEISETFKTHSLMPADLSDISIESEISKHLPEIAEPSPVVTDMSDSSNESEVHKSFDLPTQINSNNAIDSSVVTEISLPDLSLVLPNMGQASSTLPANQQKCLENTFNQLNCSLNTPIKNGIVTPKEGLANNSTNDLNTPLKFTLSPEVENNNMPLKNSLEHETDNNVTKFLDLILNKSVTDAESETQHKIIKELNALTADTATEAPEKLEDNINNDIIQLESKSSSDNRIKLINPVKPANENKTLNDQKSDGNTKVLKEQKTATTNSCKPHKTFESSTDSHKENKSSTTDIVKTTATLNAQIVSRTQSANNELNPPKDTAKEESRVEFLSDIANSKLLDTVTPASLSSTNKIKSPLIQQTFNIKCRVRLKRFNIDEHCKTTDRDTWVIITKPEESISSNNSFSKCDTMTETKLTIKKTYLKYNKYTSGESEEKIPDTITDVTTAIDTMPTKKAKLEVEQSIPINEATQTPIAQHNIPTQPIMHSSQVSIFNTTSATKSKNKPLKTFNFNEDVRDNTASSHKQKSKSNATGASGCYLKNSRPPRKLPDNNLRAAETLQLFVNSINDSTRTPPSAEFNKKRSPIKNKCIAEDETPRPPPASTLMGTPPCKKTCIEKSRSQITSTKCKDQLVSSLSTPSISSITSDIATARIYTSSPLDQTLPEYDDNVDTVADSELILPTTTGSLRRKLKKPKKTMIRPEPTDDISTDDISNQPECNGEEDTDAVVDDVFAQELLPIPAANEHILEEIVSARPPHIGTATVIRDEYMNIEATATVPDYLFNDESRDLATPEPIQSSDTTNVVDSSSYLNNSSSTALNNNNVVPAVPGSSNLAAIGNLEKSMLSPSEHEVSSTQETFYQTPNKNKQTEMFGEKSSTSKDKGNNINSSSLKQMPEDNNFQNKANYQASSNTGLLQNNQVDTTNHSPEMCTLALTGTTNTTTNMASNRKIRKASTHDEILFNELQQQQQQPPSKRKSSTVTFCVESTSDNNKSNTSGKTKVISNNLEDVKSNGSLVKVEDKFKKLLKDVCKRDRSLTTSKLDDGVRSDCNNGGGGGGSSPSTTTIINEEKLLKSKRKKQKSSKSSKSKIHDERSSKIVLKASKLTPHIPTNRLIITIPKSRLPRPPSISSPPTPAPIECQDEQQQQSECLKIPNTKFFIEKHTEIVTAPAPAQPNINHHQSQHNHAAQSIFMAKKELNTVSDVVTNKSKRSQSPINTTLTEVANIFNSETLKEKLSASTTLTTKKNEKVKFSNDNSSNSSYVATLTGSNNDNFIYVKDKYDFIKSKDKHHRHKHEQQQEVKEKTKDKAKSQKESKAVTLSNTRSLKSTIKEKKKNEKVKEKNKITEKSTTQQHTDSVLKLNISQSSNKPFSSSPATGTLSAPPLSLSNTKQINSKSNKSSLFASSISSSSSSTCSIIKSKTNLSTTQSLATAAITVSSQIPTATLSTNNIRKKLKVK